MDPVEWIDNRTRRGNRGASRCFRSRNHPVTGQQGPPDRPQPVTRARVALSDVAARAGVSRTTASFVLTGRRDMRISADTEQKCRPRGS